MITWRIANKNRADLSGHGGLYYSGRWHSQGKPIVYFAEHPALAALEVLVNMDIDVHFLTQYVMMKIEISDSANIERIDIDPHDKIKCQKTGDAWLKASSSPICRVKSAISPESYNYLFNPLHPDARQVEIVDIKPFAFDARLFD